MTRAWRRLAHPLCGKLRDFDGTPIAHVGGMRWERALLLAVVATEVGLGGCGGKGVSSAGSAAPETPQAGAGGGAQPHGTAGRASTPGDPGAGASMAMPPAAGGMTSVPLGSACSAVCIPTAQLVVTTGAQDDQFLQRSFEACRNDECYQGSFPVGGGGNTMYLAGGTGDETTVAISWDTDGGLTLHLSWSLKAYSTDFVDGDHYTLKATALNNRVLMLIDTRVQYEHDDFCAGPCTRTFLPGLLPVGDSGAGGEGGQGAF